MFSSPQVMLFSEHVERTVGFYLGLGFSETFRVPGAGEPIHVDVVLDGYKIGVASAASVRDDHGLDPVTTGQRAAIVVWADDVRAAYADLVAAGAPQLKPPYEWLGRLLIAWIADPDGNPVQLVQPLCGSDLLSEPGIHEDLAEAEADIAAGRVYHEAQVRQALNLPPRR